MKNRLSLIAAIIFLIFVATFYFFPNFLLTFELKLFDQFSLLSKDIGYFFPKLQSSKHLSEIIVVSIDDTTIQKVQKKVPFPRYIFADLLQRIYKGSPKVVVFDILFSGESEDKNSDQLLIEALQDKKNILLPYAIGELGQTLQSDAILIGNFIPAGYLNKPLDMDMAIRKVRPFDLTIEGNIRDLAIELHVFSRYYDYNLDNIKVKNKLVTLSQFKPKEIDEFKKFNFSLRSDDTLWIKYQASTDDFHKIPMWQVLSDSFNPDVFKDKIVFVGATAKVFHDVYDTPLRIMSGVETMANASLMFLDGRFIEEAPQWSKWLVIFVFCFLMVFLCYYLGFVKGFLFIVSSASIITTLTFWLFLKDYYFNPLKIILICIISYIAINFYKYASVVFENIQLRRISTTDVLTGLSTFRLFEVVVEHEFQKCLRYKTPLSLLMIDIDNFKKINDTYGHQKGNVVLSKIGKIILNNIRKADFPARYGGEEMAILLPNSNIEGAQKCAENIRRLIENEEFFITNQGPFHATVSIGVSSFPAMNIASTEEMVKFADAALYKAKREGKNRVVIYNAEGA